MLWSETPCVGDDWLQNPAWRKRGVLVSSARPTGEHVSGPTMSVSVIETQDVELR